MAKKILLASGCSWTDKNFYSLDKSIPDSERGGWPMWPEIMAKHLNLQCINTGFSGSGSDYILDRIHENILKYKNKIEIITILWSGADRFSLYGSSSNLSIRAAGDLHPKFKNLNVNKNTQLLKDINEKIFKSAMLDYQQIYKNLIDQHLQKMCIILDICKLYNIKIIMAQGVNIFPYHSIDEAIEQKCISAEIRCSNKNILKNILSSQFFPYLEKNKKSIIGWPFKNVLGGYSIDYFLMDNDFETYTHRISDYDSHPNAEGQKIIAREFIKRYDELSSL